MIRCVRCTTELADSARFCASCGAAVETAPVDPLEATAAAGATVNPYATTQRPDVSRATSEPPPPMPVSPLAASAAISHRNAFQELVDAAKKKKETPAPDVKNKLAGTQMMAGAPVRPAPTPAPAPAPAKKPAPRTVAMGNWAPKPASTPPAAAAPSNAVPGGPAPSGPKMPASAVSPSAHASFPSPQAGPLLPSPQAAPTAPQAPSGPGGWGWNAPSRGYAFAPGAHVQVTWSNGQRYPAVVVQVSGAQCLVVFPDGQQHWVETHFLG